MAWNVMRAGSDDVRWIDTSRVDPVHGANALLKLLMEVAKTDGSFFFYKEQPTVDEAFQHFDSFRVLCATRGGLFGVESVNAIMTKEILGKQACQHGATVKSLPIMVTKNDYNVKLFNGDIGLVWKNVEDTAARVFFPNHDADTAKGSERFKPCPVSLLPEHETAFALTVHKAHGSGFEHVLVVLPPEPDSPILTCELLYTAVTRAKRKVTVLCAETSFRAAVGRRTKRASGLANAMRQACASMI